MAVSNPLQGHPNGAQLRKEAGAYLKKLREAAGLTQQEVAKAVGFDYYTMVSQIERGVTSVPSDKRSVYALVLGMAVKPFVMRLLMYYDPYTWEALNSPDA